MSLVPCGRNEGFGEYCVADRLCSACIEIERLRKELADSAEYAEKWKDAYEELALTLGHKP